jgi:hypothetical protein
MLKAELLDTRMTPAQRRAEMAERAHALAARREAERQVSEGLHEQDTTGFELCCNDTITSCLH